MPYPARPAAERFWEKVDLHGSIPDYRPSLGPCWLWGAGRTGAGYGAFYVGSKRLSTFRQVLAHRWSYDQEHGEIPDGLEIDHLCRNRACIRPSHLEAVTRQVNQLRGFSASGLASRRTHCPQGHAYDQVNTVRKRNGNRLCRLCRRSRWNSWYRRTRSVAARTGPQ